jgi:hypothetical protein
VAKTKAPNQFELRGGGARITWTVAGIDGEPHLTYDEGERHETFGRDDLRVFKSVMGRLVTAPLEMVPDAYTLTLTLVVPQVNLSDRLEQQVRTIAILTTEHSPFGGPGLFKGQLQSYKILRLTGRARAVEF